MKYGTIAQVLNHVSGDKMISFPYSATLLPPWPWLIYLDVSDVYLAANAKQSLLSGSKA